MEDNIAIKVSHVSKTFKIPHEKVSSLRGAAVSVFKRNRGYEEFKVYPVVSATGALDDVSFEVKKGEFFGIIGRNGSGKSKEIFIKNVLEIEAKHGFFHGLTVISDFATIVLIKTTRPDPLGMAGFVF